MSHVSHARLGYGDWIRAHRIVALAALAACVAAVVLVLLLAGSGDQPTGAGGDPAPATRASSGPDESGIAAAIGSRGSGTSGGHPDEAAIAGAISGR
jgi:hypothetical protein